MATAADPEMAAAIGVNTVVVAVVAFAASAFFAVIAGLLIGPTTFANPYLGDTFGTRGFIVMMIGGGTEKPVAAMFGGILLGVCAEGANALINSQASDWFPFVVLVIILIVSPKGLFSAGNLFRPSRRAGVAAPPEEARVETERIQAPLPAPILRGAGFLPPCDRSRSRCSSRLTSRPRRTSPIRISACKAWFWSPRCSPFSPSAWISLRVCSVFDRWVKAGFLRSAPISRGSS